MSHQSVLVDVFRKDIRGILLAGDLGQGEIMGTEAVLYPKIGCGKVSHLAQHPPAADPYCCACIGLEVKLPVKTKISRDRYRPE